MKSLFSTLVVTGLMLGMSYCSKKVQMAEVRPQKDSGTFKVLTYNIHHANPPSKKSGEIDLEAIAEVIRASDADIIALQEVDVFTKRSGLVDQAKELANLLNMNYYFGKAINYDGGKYGVAILSRYKITDPKTIHLPEDAHPESEDRVLAIATIELSNQRFIRFGSSHWDAGNADNRKLQANAINNIAKLEKLPFILAGDFNSTPDSKAFELINRQFVNTCVNCEFTIPVLNPNKTIDYIMYSNKKTFQVVSHQTIPEKYASDHLPVTAVLKLN